MAKISAWMGLLAAAAIAVSIAMQGRLPEFGAVGPIAAAVLLGMGAYRTLSSKSGGPLLLCGAWGLTTGLAWYAPSYDFPDFVPGVVAVASPVLISAIGLALVVLQRDAK